MSRLRKLGLGLLALGACLALPYLAGAGAAGVQAQSVLEVWSPVRGVIPGTANLTSVFMLDANNAWVAGYEGHEGRAYRIAYGVTPHGPAWGMVAAYSLRAPVRGISVVADNNVWAVGDAGLIAHKGATGWDDVPQPVSGANLTTIQMLGDGQEGWAAGGLPSGDPNVPPRTVLLHYTGGQWQDATPSGVRGAITDLHLVQGGGYATVGGTLVLRYSERNREWTPETLPDTSPGCYGHGIDLAGVRTVSSDEAWVVGTVRYYCNTPFPPSVIGYHRSRGGWTRVLPSQLVGAPASQGFYQASLSGVSFSGDGFGLAVGWQADGLAVPPVPYVISYRSDGQWHYEQTPCLAGAQLSAVSQADAAHALAVGTLGTILSYGYGGEGPSPCASPTPFPTATPVPTPPPTRRVDDPHDPRFLYFPIVGHSIQGGFRDYWTSYGGLEQFGYPLTQEFVETSPTDGKQYTVQYFERARFEWHPENRPPYDVLLGLLGRTITRGRENEPAFRSTTQQVAPGSIYFAATGHNMPAQFAGYWTSHGGLPVYGYPISEAFMEVSPTDGKPYLVQYFERNRFEYHPELPEAYRVSLGLLGVQVLQDRGWIEK